MQVQRIYGIQGRSTVLVWLRKHGNLDWNKPRIDTMFNPRAKEIPSQKIIEGFWDGIVIIESNSDLEHG